MMKIWLQSGSALTSDAGTPYGRLYEQSLERHLKAMARPDTELKAFGIEGTPFGKDRYHASFQAVVSLMIKSALRAEPQGFDAVAVINTFDHGYYELRELLDIPVVFITARVHAGEVESFRERGAAGVLKKPFDPMSLAQDVRQFLP